MLLCSTSQRALPPADINASIQRPLNDACCGLDAGLDIQAQMYPAQPLPSGNSQRRRVSYTKKARETVAGAKGLGQADSGGQKSYTIPRAQSCETKGACMVCSGVTKGHLPGATSTLFHPWESPTALLCELGPLKQSGSTQRTASPLPIFK